MDVRYFFVCGRTIGSGWDLGLVGGSLGDMRTLFAIGLEAETGVVRFLVISWASVRAAICCCCCIRSCWRVLSIGAATGTGVGVGTGTKGTGVGVIVVAIGVVA